MGYYLEGPNIRGNIKAILALPPTTTERRTFRCSCRSFQCADFCLALTVGQAGLSD
jgi:hypothetical protein